MKTLKLLFVALFATLLLVSCEKDENGNRVTYYKDKVGEGYVFYSYSYDQVYPFDSVVVFGPAKNICIEIEAIWGIGGGFFESTKTHVDMVYTDENGKYFFDFLKTINGKRAGKYYVSILDPIGTTAVPSNFEIWTENIKNDKIILIDTCLLNIHNLADTCFFNK